MTKSKFLSVLLCVAILLVCVPLSVLNASATNTAQGLWTDYAAEEFAGGVGSETDPYQIATAAQLAKLSKDVSNKESYSGKFFKITENIDLSEHRWVPIGLYRWEDDNTEYGNTTNNEPFRGFIDGNNKTLTGLYVDESTTQYSAGFIGNIINTSANKVGVKDLSIVNAEIIANESGLKELNAGILVGTTMANEGYTISFENITVSGNINVTMSRGNHKVGGMIGSANRLTVKNCKAENISITGATNAGGIVGCDGGSTFENCTASGKISGGWSLGGFVGYSTSVGGGNSGRSAYTKCAANVEITGNDWCLGGFVGGAEYGKFDKCVSTGKVTSTVTTFKTKIGGFMGESWNAIADKCHTVSKVISASTDYNPGGFIGNFEDGTFSNCSFDNESNNNMAVNGMGKTPTGATGCKTNVVLENICEDYYGEHKYEGFGVCTHNLKCERCGKGYTNTNTGDQTTMKHIEAKAATTEAEGNTEYWYCENCHRYFSDKDGNNEIKLSDTVIAKLTKNDDAPPATGDNTQVALLIGLLAVSACGLLAVTACTAKRKFFVK